jgi:hypothetical protein
MKASIIFDEHDNIVSIAKVVHLKEAGSKFSRVGVVPGKGQRKIDLELAEEVHKMPLRDVHRHFRVDHAKGKLVRKDAP